jgi:peptide/nickel transport system substrate-binding protein
VNGERPRREKDGGFPMRAGLAARQARNRSGVGRRGAYHHRALAACCAAVGLVGLVAACGPASGAASGGGVQPSNTSTVTYAMQPETMASYAFPFISVGEAAQYSIYNVNDFQYLLYRPLYWFGSGVNPYLNNQLSLAYPPTYNGNTVTIRLKPNWKWSNGEPVDAADVVFFMNMMTAEANSQTNSWIGTTPDGLPGDVSNVRAVSQYVVTMDITAPFSETWFTNNELSQITPMPMAWDRTASGSSNCATTIASCDAVYSYLNAQSLTVKTYGTSPIWGVVDGPWKVQTLDTLGNLTLTFNTKYSGPVSPHHITTFIEVPFTTESAEYNVLQDPTGSQVLDVGYLPTVDAPVPPAGANVGSNPRSMSSYSLSAVYPWGLNYFPYNFNNNTGQGPIFQQLYFRQAFQELVDQEGVINGPLHGYGKPDIGPVAAYPITSYLSPQVAREGDQWTLNIQKAFNGLKSRGWVSQGTGQPLKCGNPGPGQNQCGPGVPAGAQLKFTLMYATGLDYMESAARELASNASLAGIQISLDPEPFNNVTGAAFDPTNHSWQLAEWGGWTYSPDYLPTGETLFQAGSANNAGNYNDAKNNLLITATLQARTPTQFDNAMYAWQNYVAGQLPVVYTPNTPTLVETIKGLNIGPENSAYTITPEMWFYAR